MGWFPPHSRQEAADRRTTRRGRCRGERRCAAAAAGVARRPRWLPALGWRPALAPTPPASASRGSPGWPGPSGLLGAARPGAPDRRGGDQPVRDTAQLPGFPDLGAGHVHRVQGQLPGDPVLDLFNCAEVIGVARHHRRRACKLLACVYTRMDQGYAPISATLPKHPTQPGVYRN
jgi:hypothetical protein